VSATPLHALTGLVLALAAAHLGDELDELERALRAPFPDARRRAVKKVAELATPRAWQLVVEALADPEPEVADEAQLALGALADEAVLGELLGRAGLRARDDWVRLRVAEALGRVPLAIDGRELARALEPRDVDVARALLWSLERAAAGGRLAGETAGVARKLEPLLRRGLDPRVRASALTTLARLDAAGAGGLARAHLADDDPAVRCAALAALFAADPERASRDAARLAADPEPRVRAELIEVCADAGTRDSLLLLVDVLEREERSRLAWQLVGALRRATGLKHRADPRPWRDFLSALPSDWRAVEPAPVVETGPRTGATFVGLPIISDRVCFLIDFSGSTWREREGGRTRKEVLDGKLREALEALPAECEFNVVPYTGSPHPLGEALVPATPANVRKALDFFEGCRARGQGNVFDALLLALADPRVDTVVVLTDGEPTGGRRWNMELMVELLAEENRYRNVAFDSILVDARRGLRRPWEELAARTGGRSIGVALE